MGLARLGMRSLDELVGRADLLRQKDDLQLGKTTGLDMSFLTTYAGHEPGDSTQRVNNKVGLVDVCMCSCCSWMVWDGFSQNCACQCVYIVADACKAQLLRRHCIGPRRLGTDAEGFTILL